MKLFKKNPDKALYWLMFIIIVGTMIPVLYIGRYAVPCLDDFYFGQRPRHAWILTHSLKNVIKGGCDMVAFYFMNREATYASGFFSALYPGVLNEKWYFLTPIIMTTMLLSSMTAFVHTVIKDCMAVKNKYLTGIVNMMLIFICVQNMYAPLEAFYSYNLGMYYIFMQSVMYFQITLIIKFLHTDKKSVRVWAIIIASLLGIITGGGNLVSGLQACILIVLHIIYMILQTRQTKKEIPLMTKIGINGRNNKADLWVLIPELITFAAFMVDVTAPGNAGRMAGEVQMNPVKAIIESFYWAASHGITWITPMTIVVAICVAVIIWKLAGDTNTKYINPAFAIFVSYCIFSAMFTPTFYATSGDAPNRIMNIIRITENVLIFLNIVNGLGYYRTTSREKDNLLGKLLHQTDEHYIGVVLTCILTVCVILVMTDNKNTYTSISATRSILNGEAARYYAESWERFDVYHENENTGADVVVKKLSDNAKPYLLFKEDIGNENLEEGYWQNVMLTQYYGLGELKVVSR